MRERELQQFAYDTPEGGVGGQNYRYRVKWRIELIHEGLYELAFLSYSSDYIFYYIFQARRGRQFGSPKHRGRTTLVIQAI